MLQNYYQYVSITVKKGCICHAKIFFQITVLVYILFVCINFKFICWQQLTNILSVTVTSVSSFTFHWSMTHREYLTHNFHSQKSHKKSYPMIHYQENDGQESVSMTSVGKTATTEQPILYQLSVVCQYHQRQTLCPLVCQDFCTANRSDFQRFICGTSSYMPINCIYLQFTLILVFIYMPRKSSLHSTHLSEVSLMLPWKQLQY